MNEIDTSMIDQYVGARWDATKHEGVGNNVVAAIMRDQQELDGILTNPEKSARHTAFGAMKHDSGMEISLLTLSTFDPEPGNPHYAKYHETLGRLINIRTSHAAVLHLNLIRNMFWTGSNIMKYLDEQPLPANGEYDIDRMADMEQFYIDNGPTKEFLEWSHDKLDIVSGSSSSGLVFAMKTVREFDERAKPLIDELSDQKVVTLEQAILMAELCLHTMDRFHDLFSEEETRRIVSVADAVIGYLEVHTGWQSRPGFAVRVGSFAFVYKRLRNIAESTAYSKALFLQKQDAYKAQTGGTVAAVVVAAVIEEPSIDLESYETAKELLSLLKADKSEIKSQLGETGKRLVQGDADPLIQLKSCPDNAQNFAKKLLLAIATSPDADRVMELLSQTALRSPESVSDPTVKASIEACRWVQSNIAALAHKKYTYRNHVEGQLVETIGRRYAAFMQARELVNTNN